MNKLYEFIEHIRKQTIADELDVRTSAEGMTFTFAWNTRSPGQMWFFRRHYSWGELDHAPDQLIYNDLIHYANREFEMHTKALAEIKYKDAMGVL